LETLFQTGISHDLVIHPGYEEESWQQFLDQGIDKFLGSTYKGAYQDQLITRFDALLPEDPPWCLG